MRNSRSTEVLKRTTRRLACTAITLGLTFVACHYDATAQANTSANLTPTAAMADPHNLSGMWSWVPKSDAGGARPPAGVGIGAPFGARKANVAPQIKPEFEAQIKPGTLAPNQGALVNNNAAMLCVPDAYVGSGGGYPNAIVQTANQVTIINEENHRIRRIYLDRQHPRNVKPSYAGHSIGHWEGDTLVVDTVGLRNRYHQQNPPGYRMVERFKKVNNGTQLEYTVEFRSDAYASPGVNSITFNYRPDLHLQEQICEEFSDNFNEDYYK